MAPAEGAMTSNLSKLRAGAGLVPVAGVCPVARLRMATGRFDVILVDIVSEDGPATTGKLDHWEIERVAELEAEEAQAAQDQRREVPSTS